MLKTILLLLSFLFVIWAFANSKCGGKRYKCGTSNLDNVCVNVSEYRGKIHELSKCTSDKECLWDSAEYEKPVYCTEKPAANLTLPGEPCGSSSDCQSSICTDGFCLGKKSGQACTSHSECDIGYYCDSYCQAQIQFEEACTDDYQCQNNCVCNLGKCAFYYSLDNNIEANNSKACLNGYVHSNGTCQLGPHSQIKSRPCETDGDCLLLDKDDKLFGYSECQCGFNAGGFSYCSLAEGDEEYLEAISLFQWLLQVNQYCHTLLRFGPCHSLYSDEVTNYQKALKFYEMRAQIQYNDECIKDIYTPEYWEISGTQIILILILYSIFI